MFRPKLPRTTKPNTGLELIEDEKIDYPEPYWRRYGKAGLFE